MHIWIGPVIAMKSSSSSLVIHVRIPDDELAELKEAPDDELELTVTYLHVEISIWRSPQNKSTQLPDRRAAFTDQSSGRIGLDHWFEAFDGLFDAVVQLAEGKAEAKVIFNVAPYRIFLSTMEDAVKVVIEDNNGKLHSLGRYPKQEIKDAVDEAYQSAFEVLRRCRPDVVHTMTISDLERKRGRFS